MLSGEDVERVIHPGLQLVGNERAAVLNCGSAAFLTPKGPFGVQPENFSGLTHSYLKIESGIEVPLFGSLDLFLRILTVKPPFISLSSIGTPIHAPLVSGLTVFTSMGSLSNLPKIGIAFIAEPESHKFVSCRPGKGALTQKNLDPAGVFERLDVIPASAASPPGMRP